MASLPDLPTPILLKIPVSSEPADKWASNTLEVVSGEQSRIQGLSQSNMSTPGIIIPGSFPPHSASMSDVDYIKDAAFSAFETAKDYVGSAGEKVGQYVPARVSSYLPASLSPSNSQSMMPGSSNTCNGTSSESLAQPPEERKPEEEEGGHSANGLESVSGESLAKLPEERLQESLPSHDDESSVPLGSTAGVGALPGKSDEIGVARLPGENEDDFECKPQNPLVAQPFSLSQSYLNPSFTQGQDEYPKPTDLPYNVHEDHGDRERQEACPISSRPSAQQADTDASTQRLIGSHIDNTDTSPTCTELEPLREHDASHSKIDPATFLISSRKPNASKTRDHPKAGPTVSLSAGDMTKHNLCDTSANKPINTCARTHPLGSPNAQWHGVSLAESEQQRLDANEIEQLEIGQPPHGKLVGASVSPEKKGTALEIKSPRDQPPPVPEEAETDRVTQEALYHNPAETGAMMGGGGGGEPGHTQNAIDGDTRSPSSKKAGFVKKIKGEMKILSGKLSHSEEKIEEGRRMMGRN